MTHLTASSRTSEPLATQALGVAAVAPPLRAALNFTAPHQGSPQGPPTNQHSRAGGHRTGPPLRWTPQRVPPGSPGPDSKPQKTYNVNHNQKFRFRHQCEKP